MIVQGVRLMDNEIKGISFPFRIGGRGGWATSGPTFTHQQKVKERIKSLLGIKEFERVMRPWNGLEELDIFFNDLNETTKNMAEFKIREKLQQMEPEIQIIDIQLNTQTLLDGKIIHIISLTYMLVGDREASTLSVEL